MPIYDKPLIYYPISTLMLANIREILIICTPFDLLLFQRLLGDGSRFGLKFSYAVQDYPRGIVDGILLGNEFIGSEAVALILGDNIFYGQGLGRQLASKKGVKGASIFAYKVSEPQHYGVVELDAKGAVLSIEEKPRNPKSNYAIPGLYFYDNSVVEFARKVQPSERGELEITDLNRMYFHEGKLSITVLDRGTAWLDTGTFDALHAASSFVKAIEDRQGYKIACLEEIAFAKKWISSRDISVAIEQNLNSPYGNYLLEMIRK
jgi:glucose-1-phosphate thymidylyltransferase